MSDWNLLARINEVVGSEAEDKRPRTALVREVRRECRRAERAEALLRETLVVLDPWAWDLLVAKIRKHLGDPQ